MNYKKYMDDFQKADTKTKLMYVVIVFLGIMILKFLIPIITVALIIIGIFFGIKYYRENIVAVKKDKK